MAQWNERPRSVRQIGSPERSCRVYLEDYADTYIRRIPADGPQGVHAGALYGRKMVQDGLQCYYIFGAVETEPVWEDARLRFGQKAWKKIEQMRQNYFPTMDVCGWFVRTEEDFMPDTEQLQRVQDTFFAETGEILYTVAGEEGTFFRKGQSLLYPLQGYYVFYQNNTAMQEYLAQTGSRQKSGVRLESLRERPPQKTQNQTPQEAAKRRRRVHKAVRGPKKKQRLPESGSGVLRQRLFLFCWRRELCFTAIRTGHRHCKNFWRADCSGRRKLFRRRERPRPKKRSSRKARRRQKKAGRKRNHLKRRRKQGTRSVLKKEGFCTILRKQTGSFWNRRG